MNWNISNFFKSKNSNITQSEKHEWENLTVFKSLNQNEWKNAFKDLTKIVGDNLKEYGFKKKGNRFYRLTNDLLEVIDIDNRGSWTGKTADLKIRIGLIPYCLENLTKEYYLACSKNITEIDKTIRKHFKISKEYEIFADYLTKRIIATVLPFFNKYNSTKKIVDTPYIFPFLTKNDDINKSQFLILCSELKQHKIKNAFEIIDNEIEYQERFKNEDWQKFLKSQKENLEEVKNDIDKNINKWNKLKKLIKNDEWKEIDELLLKNENTILAEIKVKPVGNNQYKQ